MQELKVTNQQATAGFSLSVPSVYRELGCGIDDVLGQPKALWVAWLLNGATGSDRRGNVAVLHSQ
jgi:hypothetical protein